MTPAVLLRVLLEHGASLLSPPRCAACNALIGVRRVFCPPCAHGVVQAHPDLCGDVAPFQYGGPIARAIVRFKYEGAAHLARPLGDLMRRGAPMLGAFAPHVVVPVPLHVTRLVARGYNQAALLGGPIARELGAPLAPRALVRTRDTPQQALLARGRRLLNVRGAFEAPDPRAIRGRRVLLVDDVRTTGATLHACEAALRTAGARDVRSLVLAVSDAGADTP